MRVLTVVGLWLCLGTLLSSAYDCSKEPKDGIVDFDKTPWCPQSHCSAVIDPFSGQTFEVKMCEDLGKHAAGYCFLSYVRGQPTQCKCACSCLAYGTPILLGNGSNGAVEKIRVGDEVLVANGKKWEPLKVVSSSGTSPTGREEAAFYITTEHGLSLVGNAQQLFYIADQHGKERLARADQLDPAKHFLLDKEFKKLKISSVQVGEWNGGLWHIATEHPSDYKPTDLANAHKHHLLLANGVVVGDWYLQKNFAHQVALIEDLPVIAADQRSPPPPVGPSSISMLRTSPPKAFVGFHARRAESSPPEHAKGFIPLWAQVGPHVSKKLDTLDTIWRREFVTGLIGIFKGAYDDIIFELEWLDEVANAYSWQRKGSRHVGIHGGILRHKALHWEGLAFILARQVAQVTLKDQTYDNDPFSLSCEGWADYNAGIVLQRVFTGGPIVPFGQVIEPGLKQLKAFLSSFPSKGTVLPRGCGHPKNAIDVDCRLSTFENVFYAQEMPSCWEPRTTTDLPPKEEL